MNTVKIFKDKNELAEAAAEQTITTLGAAIETYGNATWVLAGGSTPLAAYQIIAHNYRDGLDWTKVIVLIGDERIGALDGSDNNWHAIDQTIGDLPTVKLRPRSDQSPELAARDYHRQLQTLAVIKKSGMPRLDLVWLGIGSDGHTLSLFPNHPSLQPTTDLIIAVHDSPKPPADRISMSLRALSGTVSAMILASGSDKQLAITAVQQGASSPIALAAKIIQTHGGDTTWLIDQDASPTD